MAQAVATWQEVQVNPVQPGGNVLLYPGGEYSRSVPALRYPGEPSGPIQLHMPGTRRHAVASAEAEPAAPRRKVAIARPAPPPEEIPQAAPKPAPKAAHKVAKAEPAPSPAPSPAYNPYAAPDFSNVFGNAPAPQAPKALPKAPQPSAQPGPKTASAAPAPPPVKTAPAGPTNGNEKLTKRSVILFAKDAPDPAKQALGALKFLAGDLNAAMSSPNARIELQAFGGTKGDKGSDARRLSLKRALSIRQVLIDDGVSSDRIDVRAMGGVDDTGPTDRVDVYVKA